MYKHTNKKVNEDFPLDIFNAKMDRDGVIVLGFETKDESKTMIDSFTPEVDFFETYGKMGKKDYVELLLDYPSKELLDFTVYKVYTYRENAYKQEHVYWFYSLDKALTFVERFIKKVDKNINYEAVIEKFPLYGKVKEVFNTQE